MRLPLAINLLSFRLLLVIDFRLASGSNRRFLENDTVVVGR
jgi:hypothetical protein